MSISKLPLAESLGRWRREITRAEDSMTTKDINRALVLQDTEALVRQQHEALKRADMFITNGIELGKIQMPDADCPDPAHKTPGIIKAAIAAAEGEQS